MKQKFIWLDGNLIPWQKATIHLMTHTLHYGSGAFEGIRCYKTKDNKKAIFRLEDHVNRLLNSFSSFEVFCPWTKDAIIEAIKETIIANKLSDCYIRPLFFLGDESLGIDIKNLSCHLAIIALPIKQQNVSESVSVGFSSIERIQPQAVNLTHKINGLYINSIFALNEAKKRGFDEALLLDHKGIISEGSVANIFFVIDNILVTPKDDSILPGITRDTLINLASNLDIPFCKKDLTKESIKNATEAFFTGTMSEIKPIKNIEDTFFKNVPGPLTKKLITAYKNVVLNKSKVDNNWITII